MARCGEDFDARRPRISACGGAVMTSLRRRLLDMIDADRDALIALLSQFARARSPNPPGDTREAAAVLRGWLDCRNAPYRTISPDPTMPNLLGTFQGTRPG